MKEKSLSKKQVYVEELLSLVPEDLLQSLSKELDADKSVKKLKAAYFFKLMLFSLLNSERLSLRVMEDNSKDLFFKALCTGLEAGGVSWVAIRDRLMALNTDFSRRLYEFFYQELAKYYDEKLLEKYNLKRYDSTMIPTFSYLLDGMKVGNTSKGKTQAKLTVEFKNHFQIQASFHKDQAYLSEEVALKEAVQKGEHTDEDICVFDKGLKSRKTFEELDKKGTLFVGRLHGEPRYELLYPHFQDDGMSDTEELEFMQDSAVNLYGSGAILLERKFRLVQFRRKEDGQLLSFVTNIWDLSAELIAQIYRKRWDIEVLFRFMKQEMNLTHFVCNDTNAIQNMLYFKMIATMLILIYKVKNKITSYKRAKTRFTKELLYTILAEILESPEKIESLRGSLRQYVKME